MIRSKEKPIIYEACVKKFGVDWDKFVIFTYGETIHCKVRISKQKLPHERVHIRQQKKITPEVWWIKYLEDPEFRLNQELEAYEKEIEWVRANVRDINLRKKITDKIIADLTGSMYGNIITGSEAREILKL